MKKITCIIIDDEPLICQLIKKLGNWEYLNIEIAAICYDGETALNEISRCRPDIVLSDIRLPVYDGLEIMQHTYSMNLHPCFAIISGYGEFEYAQQAIKLGAVDYLLKPVNKEKLNDVLSRCCEIVSAKSRHLETQQALAKARSDLFWSNLTSANFSRIPREDFLEKYGSSVFCFAVFVVSRKDLISDNIFFNRIMEIFSRSFPENHFSSSVYHGTICLYFIMNDELDIDRQLQKLFVEIKYMRENMGDFSLTIGHSIPFRSIEDINIHFFQAQKAAAYRFEIGSDSIISYKQISELSNSVPPLFTETLGNNLLYLSKTLNAGKMRELIDTLENNFMASHRQYCTSLEETLLNVLNTILDAVLVENPDTFRNEFLAQYQCCTSYAHVFDLLRQFATQLIRDRINEGHSELSSSIKTIQDYISLHYAEKILLDDLAKLVYLSPSYLSTIFKKELGISITEYINLIRCEHAKSLLMSSRLGLSSIAEKIGYADEKYFFHQFKKTVGITPTQFRRLHT